MESTAPLDKTASPDLDAAPHAPASPVIRIEPTRGWVAVKLKELWDYRELLYFLVWRDVKVRYKQTVLGAAWALLQPLFTMLVFSIFFGRLAGIPSDGVPYPLFALAALIPWTFFANALGQSSNSLVNSAHLIAKVYFPRLVIPLASVLGGLVDLAVACSLFVPMLLYYGITPGWGILWLPGFVLLAIVTALGVGLWASALNVEYRDVRHVISFATQLWMFLTPVVYPGSLVPERWRLLYNLNPMSGVVDGFRWALLGAGAPPGLPLLASALASLTLLVTGAFYFRRMEKTFADRV
ncbi:ABC transporter permease [Chloracidobacterium thermophilum]|uniref:Transport permease protein n=1 Tax=Chloracidobacterium thermophilum (strain B) TaxID=981222 RepID=G2LJ68_CHLTF|nr:ABC transporter permease [Chloracidobacterium thermophilum]AEP12355.1 ABC-type polysaccharide/polyol phosphate export systems, permease component [Chloracidobacterium thermophilum B]QUV78098.1 ABC transporter permease [Chloracidobacterium thermophilum]